MSLCVLCGWPSTHDLCASCNGIALERDAGDVTATPRLLDMARRLRPWVREEDMATIERAVKPSAVKMTAPPLPPPAAPQPRQPHPAARSDRERARARARARLLAEARSDAWWGASWEVQSTVSTASILAAVADHFHLMESGT